MKDSARQWQEADVCAGGEGPQVAWHRRPPNRRESRPVRRVRSPVRLSCPQRRPPAAPLRGDDLDVLAQAGITPTEKETFVDTGAFGTSPSAPLTTGDIDEHRVERDPLCGS